MTETVAKIKSKRDAEEFVAKVDEFAEKDEYHHAMTGEERQVFSISFHYGPHDWERETIYVESNGWSAYYTASGGTRSQGATPIADPADFVWKNRKALNRMLEEKSSR